MSTIKKIILYEVLLQLLFSTSYAFTQTESALHSASFGVFSSPYDHCLDLMHWNDSNTEGFSFHTGIDDNCMNICSSMNINDIYAAFSYNEGLTNYKAWPQNMTDETEILLLGFPQNWSMTVKYYDFCYSGGKGKAEPSIGFAKTIDLGSAAFRISSVTDFKCRYYKALTMDLFQPTETLSAEYSANADNGFGLSYTCMPTLKGTHNSTDVSAIPVYHKASAWYGRIWNVEKNLRVGFHPNGYAIFNAINPVKQAHNSIPESGNLEGLVELPLSLMICPESGRCEFVFTVLMGLYYANFDHEGWTGIGGNNDAGWVPETGIGYGMTMNINRKCSIEIGVRYIRIPELTEDHDKYSYTAENVSAENLFQAPLSISIRLKN